MQRAGRSDSLIAARRRALQAQFHVAEDALCDPLEADTPDPAAGVLQAKAVFNRRHSSMSTTSLSRGLAVGPRETKLEQVPPRSSLPGEGGGGNAVVAAEPGGPPFRAALRGLFAEQQDAVCRALLEGQERLLAEFAELHAEKSRLERQVSVTQAPEKVPSDDPSKPPNVPINGVPASDEHSQAPEQATVQPAAGNGGGRCTRFAVSARGGTKKNSETLTSVLPIYSEAGESDGMDEDGITEIHLSDKVGGTFIREGSPMPSEDLGEYFTVLPGWKSTRHRKLQRGICLNIRTLVDGAGSARKTVRGRRTVLGVPGQDQEEDGDEHCYRIIHPHSKRRHVWDVASLLLTMYDMVVLPLFLFNPPEVFFTDFMGWCTRIFWTLDVGMSFRTGFIRRDGVVELRARRVIRNYLLNWFTMDILLVGFDWVETFLRLSGIFGMARGAKSVTRPLRIIRMLRLLRLIRMREAMSLVVERISSEKVLISVNITKLLSGMMWIAHMLACLWYFVSDATQGQSPGTWIVEFDYQRSELWEVYLMSLHWSLSQFTGGMDEVVAINTNERLFAICAFVIAFIVSVLLVSSLTSQMTQLSIIGSHNSKQISILRRFLSQSGISGRLAIRLQRNAQHSMQENQRVMPEESVGLLKLISEPLLEELHMEVYAPFYAAHPFFRNYIIEQPQVMRKVCHSASSTMMVCSGDIIFTSGELSAQPKMYFVRSGTLKYKPMNGGPTVELSQGNWISEQVLWTNWKHRGILLADDDCRLCMLDAQKFQEIVAQFEHSPEFDPMDYAQEFVDSMNTAPKSELTDLPGEWLFQKHRDETASMNLSSTGGMFRGRPGGSSRWAGMANLGRRLSRRVTFLSPSHSGAPDLELFARRSTSASTLHSPTGSDG